MNKAFGDMLDSIIREEKVNAIVLGKGLCSNATMSRYLCGESRPDRLLLTTFLQRLGRSPAKFATLLSQDEYVYFQWKQQVSLAQLQKDWEKIETLLQEKEAGTRICNEVLQEQFYLLMKGIVQEKLYNNHEESKRLVEQAIRITVPEFPDLAGKMVLLSTQEIRAMLLWQSLQPDKEVAYTLVEYLYKYVAEHYKDRQERVKIYPKTAGAYVQFLFDKEKYSECMTISEQAIDLMVETGYASDMAQILEIHVAAAERLNMEEKVHKKKVQLAAWKEMMRTLVPGSDGSMDNLFMLDTWQEVELIDEVIGITRRERGYSQEILSENICTPETLSRIESGKRSPSRKNYKALTMKLGLKKDVFYSDIVTDDFRVLEEEWELRIITVNKKWEEAEIKLEQLIAKLDLTDKHNRQFAEYMRCTIAGKLRKVSVEEQSKQLLDILSLTVKIPSMTVEEWPREFWTKHHFTRVEMSILLQRVDLFYLKKEYGHAIQILENMLFYYKKGKVMIEAHFGIVSLLLIRLSSLMSTIGKYELELLYSEEGIQMELIAGNYHMLADFVNNKADALEHLKQKESSLYFYKRAFYCAELMKTHSAEISKWSLDKMIGYDVGMY